MTIEIELYKEPSDTELPLYFEHGAQESRALLYLDIEGAGEMWVGSKAPSDNSWGQREHHKIQYAYTIPNNLTELGYNQLMQDDKIVALCERIVAGGSVEWDGSNFRGELNEDAESAEYELSQYLDQVTAADYSSLEPWSADMWLNDLKLSALVQDGETHEQVAERLQAEALKKDRVYLNVVDLENELDRRKEREQEDAED